jgi:hypothetical protein
MAERSFVEVMDSALSAGLSVAASLFPESGSTIDRKLDQGCAELASALFGGSDAYVAYGEGQKAVEMEAPQVEAPQVERGGMEI